MRYLRTMKASGYKPVTDHDNVMNAADSPYCTHMTFYTCVRGKLRKTEICPRSSKNQAQCQNLFVAMEIL